MSKEKQKSITLTHPILGDRDFDPDHAERLMDMENNGGWQYKTKSDAGTKGTKGEDKKSKEQGEP